MSLFFLISIILSIIFSQIHFFFSSHSGSNLPILYARIGSTSYKEGGQVLKVLKFEIHPNYEVSTLDYDFAIVSFEEGQEITLGTTARIISLSSFEVPMNVDEMIVMGWGVMEVTFKLFVKILKNFTKL